MASLISLIACLFSSFIFAPAFSKHAKVAAKTLYQLRQGPSTHFAQILYVTESEEKWLTICTNTLSPTMRQKLGAQICKQQQKKVVEAFERQVSCEETEGDSVHLFPLCWSSGNEIEKCAFDLAGDRRGCCETALEITCEGRSRFARSAMRRRRNSYRDNDKNTNERVGIRASGSLLKFVLYGVGALFVAICTALCCCCRNRCRRNTNLYPPPQEEDNDRTHLYGNQASPPPYSAPTNDSPPEYSSLEPTKDDSTADANSADDRGWTTSICDENNVINEGGMEMQNSGSPSGSTDLPPPPTYKEMVIV